MPSALTRLVAALALGAAWLAGAAGASADRSPCGAGYCAFYSPSGNISCELDWRRSGVSNVAYCQTWKPERSVRLLTGGSLHVCSGDRCLGNPGEGTPHLAYGRSVTLGPFHCSSLPSGVRCTVPSGRGFLIARAGVTRLAP